ncbi:hypothetical protein JQX13_10525 [Archangium violaceum]|uniref:hypothetical protein n=1 Tax=Archangium violaceum TaxID=83451 RepID=UPI00193C3A95|nr:hypothetical protein [Archangium violaceum]QRK10480.1 hypothetical protein JQX13_10525 [Archangium violaceum]
MRTLLVLIALLAGGYAGYVAFFVKTPYSSYSQAQLGQLEDEYTRQYLSAEGDESEALRVSLTLIREELARPLHMKAALGVAGLSLLGALALTLVRSRRRADTAQDAYGSSQELADPSSTPAPVVSREQAAALLGVRPDAPRGVIEAALQAQLAERDPSLLHGLDPTLRQRVLQQREVLTQAANLLLGRQELPLSDGSSRS